MKAFMRDLLPKHNQSVLQLVILDFRPFLGSVAIGSRFTGTFPPPFLNRYLWTQSTTVNSANVNRSLAFIILT